MATDLSAPILADALKGLAFVRGLYRHERIDSTNAEAHRLARSGAPEVTLVVADEQTAGRGRRGREWLAPAGSSLLFSLLFRPDLPASRAQYLTMICALATLDAVENIVPQVASLKWPNDLVADGRKLAGILTELGTVDNSLEYVIVGIGLNVNWLPAESPDLADIATSLQALSGSRTSRSQVLADVLRSLASRHDALRSGASPVEEWASRLGTLGQPVQVETTGGTVCGVAVGVDPSGALEVRTADGATVRLVEGDVILAHRR